MRLVSHPLMITHGIPKGVPVYAQGEAPKRDPKKPRNMLELAATYEDRENTIATVVHSLGLSNTDLAEHHLSDAKRWLDLPIENRLIEIGEWVRAECYKLLDLIEAETPHQMVGTND